MSYVNIAKNDPIESFWYYLNYLINDDWFWRHLSCNSNFITKTLVPFESMSSLTTFLLWIINFSVHALIFMWIIMLLSKVNGTCTLHNRVNTLRLFKICQTWFQQQLLKYMTGTVGVIKTLPLKNCLEVATALAVAITPISKIDF